MYRRMLSLACLSRRPIGSFLSMRRTPSKLLMASSHGGPFPVVRAPRGTRKDPTCHYFPRTRNRHRHEKHGLVAGVPVAWEDIDNIPTALRTDWDEEYFKYLEKTYGPDVMRYFKEHLHELPSEEYKEEFYKLTVFPGGVGRRAAERLIALDGGLRLKYFHKVLQDIMGREELHNPANFPEEYQRGAEDWVLTGLERAVSRARDTFGESEVPLFDEAGECLVPVKEMADIVVYTSDFAMSRNERVTWDTGLYLLSELYRYGLQQWKKAEGRIVVEEVCKPPSTTVSEMEYEEWLSSARQRYHPWAGMNYEEWFWDAIYRQGLAQGEGRKKSLVKRI